MADTIEQGWGDEPKAKADKVEAGWGDEPSCTSFLKRRCQEPPAPHGASATANDDTAGDEDLATPASKRTFEPTPDLVGQFKRMGAQLDAQRSTPMAAVNVLGNAATFGAGPAISAAISHPTLGPEYDQARAANQAQLEADRKQVGGLGTAALETAGGVVPALVAPELEGLQGLSPVARGVATGAGFGAAQGVGESLSKGDTANIGKNAAIGAMAGGATGGLLEGALHRLPAVTGNGEDNWLVHDVLGGDAKTQANPTERKVLADDEADLKYTLGQDPSLRKQVSKARGGDPAELSKLLDQTQGRIQAVIAPRDEHYANFDEDSARGGYRVGDMVDSVESRLKDFQRTGGAKERVALENVRDSLKKFEGGDHLIDPNSPQAKQFADANGVTINQAIGGWRKLLSSETDPAKRSAIQNQIDSAVQQYGTAAYNPDKIIPTSQARQVLTDLQGDVHDALGGYNERDAYKRAKLVVAPIRDAFESHLNTGDPELVGQIRDMNRKYSALKNIEAVVKQRLNKSTQQNLAVQRAPSSVRAMARNIGGVGGGALLAATGHPVLGAAMVGAGAAPQVMRGADMALSRLIAASKNPTMAGDLAGLAKDAILKGVPRSVAMQFAGSATGGEIHDAAP